jgi:hypothetical protein
VSVHLTVFDPIVTVNRGFKKCYLLLAGWLNVLSFKVCPYLAKRWPVNFKSKLSATEVPCTLLRLAAGLCQTPRYIFHNSWVNLENSYQNAKESTTQRKGISCHAPSP